jgi:DNA-binding CsgD family transcriptional regulator
VADGITPGEQAVLEGLARGETVREIGWRLCVSPKTVESHLAAVKAKQGLANMHQLMVWAIRREINWEERFMQAFEDLKQTVNQISVSVNYVVARVDEIKAELELLRDGPTAAEVQALVDQLAAEKAKLDALTG